MISLGALIAVAMSFFLALLASWAILMPFFETESAETAPNGSAKDLLLKRDYMLDALEDLEQDFRARLPLCKDAHGHIRVDGQRVFGVVVREDPPVRSSL